MRTTQSLSITLPIEMAEMVKAKVASGEYATESEVIPRRAAPLAARDVAVERWLRQEVVPAYDELKAHPERAVSLDDAFEGFNKRIKSIAAKTK
jgi:Arc/MetJ-type ribon-helix-helix transcriptional regulator